MRVVLIWLVRLNFRLSKNGNEKSFLHTMKNIAIFASGSGTNAAAIMDNFMGHPEIFVSLTATNNPEAGVIEKAEERVVPVTVFENEDLNDEEYMLELLRGIDLIVLAGFLKKIPSYLVNEFEGRIVNIHPALLPKYGGKGMYGDKVHQAVIENGEKESGISIHLVNENYDDGDVLFQDTVPVSQQDTPDTLALKVRKLEHEHYPEVIEKLVRSL